MLWCIFYWRYSFFHCRPLSAPNVHLQFLQKEWFRAAQSKVSFNSVSWMHRSERSFTECFCVVFIWRYYFFHYWPLSAPNVHLQFLQKEWFRTAQSKGSVKSVSWMHRTERSFTECFSVVFIWRYFSFTIGPSALGMSTYSFYRKSVWELLNQKQTSTLLVEWTEQKEVSQNASV